MGACISSTAVQDAKPLTPAVHGAQQPTAVGVPDGGAREEPTDEAAAESARAPAGSQTADKGVAAAAAAASVSTATTTSTTTMTETPKQDVVKGDNEHSSQSLSLTSQTHKIAAVESADGLALVEMRINQLKAKYGAPPGGDDHIQAPTIMAAVAGELPLKDMKNELYWVGEITIGQPGTKVALNFDTGSSDLFIQPHKFDPKKSTTAKATGRTFKLTYADGTHVSGDVYTDNLTVASFATKSHAIGVATESTFKDEGTDGICGLAFQNISMTKAPSLFDSLYANNKSTMKNHFAFGLWEKNTVLDLGRIDKNKYQGELAWSNIEGKAGYWQTHFQINHASANGIIDTGTTLVLGPVRDVEKILKDAGCELKHQDGLVFGLYKEGAIKNITLTFGGKSFTMSKRALSYQHEGDKIIASVCGADMGSGAPAWIVGGSFLQDVYAVFDVENKRIGFAPRKA